MCHKKLPETLESPAWLKRNEEESNQHQGDVGTVWPLETTPGLMAACDP